MSNNQNNMKRKSGRPKEKPIKEESKPLQTRYGVNVAIPNTSRQKMEAITNLSKTVLELSKALNGVNTQVTVSHNVISGVGTGMIISSEVTDDLSEYKKHSNDNIRNNTFGIA